LLLPGKSGGSGPSTRCASSVTRAHAGDASDAADELVVRTQSSSRHWLLGDIDGAIRRLAVGAYGQCEDCGAAIPRGRLKTIPYARRCVPCQRDSTG
jgi:RNA polymerase-binding transcription factor DksA